MDAKSGQELAAKFPRVEHVQLDVIADKEALRSLVQSNDLVVRLSQLFH